ncbi:hypothetical protein M409DRAFT_64544 [Zasmidium cellare ATCC 36951]|uniref:Aquaporin n=1 Tax=Zasmidium cellare ATCC 36951 TaxID=1080233 RepID=A0A6A6CU25_ZASCE|nr:uncharacterized protein M409DRAFT_64544 [Zasmidium cellare ATCC 36951]KAF2170213.1 hypothetical protein M409DRAFT_64544 [Zasmidium cellare ATCC 36951]
MPSLEGRTLHTGRSNEDDSTKSGPKDSLSLNSPPPGAFPNLENGPPSGRRPSHKTSMTLIQPRTWMGLQPQAPLQEEHDEFEHNALWWSKVKITLKEPFAEMWGTFILVLFGCGGIAQVSLGKNFPNTSPDGIGYGDWQSINWCFGLGLMLGVYVAGDSGAYLNPAVTFTSCVLRKLPWRRMPLYVLGQLIGGFLAAGVVYANYINSINAAEGHNIRTVPPAANATAGIFATYPASDLTKASQFFEQFIASSLLMFLILALQDDSNKGSFIASGSWFPLCLFFVMFGIGAAFGWQTGFAINLARDFGPRLWTYCVGYGSDVWSAGGYYFWIPMVAPFPGCLFGGILYDLFIFTGQSPINQPWFGLGQLVNPRKAIQDRLRHQKEQGLV